MNFKTKEIFYIVKYSWDVKLKVTFLRSFQTPSTRVQFSLLCSHSILYVYVSWSLYHDVVFGVPRYLGQAPWLSPPLQGPELMAGSPSTLLNKQMTTKMVANYIITFQMSHYKAKGTFLLNLFLTNKMPKVKRTCSLVLDSYLLKILQY